jgi:hypothetical protein
MSRGPLPDNLKFSGEIVKAYACMAKSGNYYLQIEINLTNTAHKGRHLFQRFMITSTKASEKMSLLHYEAMIRSAGIIEGEPPRKPKNPDDKVDVEWLIGAKVDGVTKLIENEGFPPTNAVKQFIDNKSKELAA